MKKSNITHSVIALFLVILIFILASYFTNKYSVEIEQLIGGGFVGMLIYVTLNIIEVIIAPVNILPAIAIASNIWGWFITGILTTLGWTIGAFGAFVIARKWGAPLINRFLSLGRLHDLEKRINPKNVFWSIVLARIVMPADLLSYALGLFSKIDTKKYVLATAIGVTPLAFILAYMGSLPLELQIIGFIAIGILLVTGIIIRSKIKKIQRKNID